MKTQISNYTSHLKTGKWESVQRPDVQVRIALGWCH